MENIKYENNNSQNSSQPTDNTGQNRESYPQPQEEGSNSALHFFLYLVSFLSLLFVATGLGAILYQIINKTFPDTLNTYPYLNLFTQGAVKFGLASIIIATPIYFILSFFINKYLFKGKILENSTVRKWTTYIILFIASMVVLVDFISLVYNWLGGDATARFILKILVVLFIAGSIFGYYFWDMRKKNVAGKRYFGNKIAGAFSFIVIIAVFAGALFIIDSPAETRNKKTDSEITASMQNYTYSIEDYYSENGLLPANLLVLKNDAFSVTSQHTDAISYKATGRFSYQLCADFKTSTMQDPADPYNEFGFSNEKWKHEKGLKCFDQNIDKAIQRDADDSSDLNNPPDLNNLPTGDLKDLVY